MLALVENIQRKELGIFEEATALQNLLLMTEMTQNDLAKRLSVSQSSISNKLRLLKLNSEERELIIDSSLSERHARALVRVENERVRRALLKRIIEKSLSASDTEKLIDDCLKGDFSKEKTQKKVTRIGIIKDLRFFYNTVDRALSLLGDAGIKAKSEKTEYDGYYEVVIKIAKQQ
jgi:ParB family chromosome partitioning protein